jgi:hypothetical protein
MVPVPDPDVFSTVFFNCVLGTIHFILDSVPNPVPVTLRKKVALPSSVPQDWLMFFKIFQKGFTRGTYSLQL